MLLIVGHPSIGSALETLLRIEDRYETRRVASLDNIAAGLERWRADIALVDGVLVESGRTEALTMPTIVLSGNAADAKRLSARLPAAAGWLRKDATADQLHTAIDAALRGGARAAWSGRLTFLFAALAALVAIAFAFVAFGPRG